MGGGEDGLSAFSKKKKKENSIVLCGWLEGQTFIPSLAPIRVISSILSILLRRDYSDGIDARKVPNVTEKQSCVHAKLFLFGFDRRRPTCSPTHYGILSGERAVRLHEPHCVVCHW